VADFYQLYQVIGDSFSNTPYTARTQFQLPDARSRVPGFVDQGSNLTFRTLGDSIGEERHMLITEEMPVHSHPDSNGPDGQKRGITTFNATGLDDRSGSNTYSTKVIATVIDPQHAHSYNTTNTTGGLTIGGAPAAGNSGSAITSSNSTGISVKITVNDPTHAHAIYPEGGGPGSSNGINFNDYGKSVPHNNMQPTIFMGNMFVFSGKATYNAPYTGMGVNTRPSSDGSFKFPYT